ncbi:MAG: ESPR-type extended signal peptide-containing protein [Pseudomonadota bacterium]
MNKSYRSIWNEALGAWVAASEIASARGKKSRSAQRQLAALGLGMLLLGGPALAQVGVLTPNPDPSAWLTIGPEPGAGVPNKGVLMPRAALTDATTWGLAAPTPVDGMVVFNTTAGTSANGLGVGLMTWKNGRWVNVDETPYLHVNSTAVGNSTQANSGAIGANSVAIGPDAKALANDTVAMGNGAEAHKLGDIAIGRAAIASGGDRLTGPTENWSSVAVGTYASATEGNSVALGGSAKAEGRGTALGSRAEAGYDTVAIGTFAGTGRPAKADPNDFSNSLNTFVGSGSGASGNGARNSYVGNQAGLVVQGDENAGMGYGAGGLSSGNRNVAVGQRAGQFVTGDQNINQGTMAGLQSKGSNNIALGTLASANLALAAQDPNAPISQAAVQAANLAAQTEYMGFLAKRGVTEAGLADGTYTLDASGNVIEASSGNVLVTAAELQTSVTQAFQRNGVAGIDASRTTAIGHLSRATGDDAVALGSSAVAGDKAAVAVGTASKAFGVSSVAVGDSAFAQDETSIAIGKGAQAIGISTTAIGTEAGKGSAAGNQYNTAVGVLSGQNVSGNNNTATGSEAGTDVTGNLNTASGNQAGRHVVGNANAAVGQAAGFDVTGSNNSAMGQGAGFGVKGDKNIASGQGAGAQLEGSRNTAGGTFAGTHLKGNDNVAFGTGAGSGIQLDANGNPVSATPTPLSVSQTVAVGTAAKVGQDKAIAIGDHATALSFADVAVGANAGFTKGSGQYNTALGADAGLNASGEHATAVGNGALSNSSGMFNTALGTAAGNGVTGDGNVALGAAAGRGITASETVSIGAAATAAYDKAVALGAGSTTQADLASLTATAAYVPAGAKAASIQGLAPVGEVSVGSAGNERRITNVAAGGAGTDAVNVSQLQAAQTHYYSVNDNGAQGGNYDNDGAKGANSLAAGVNASTTANAESAVAVGDGAAAEGVGAVAIGQGAQAAAANAVAVGAQARITQAASGADVNGFPSATNADDTSVFGPGATISATAAAAGPTNGQADVRRSSAMGAGARIAATGSGNQATASDSLAIGSGAAIQVDALDSRASANDSIALGRGATIIARADGATAPNTVATADSAIVIGHGAQLNVSNAGEDYSANGNGAIVIGNRAKAVTNPNISVENSITMGTDAAANGEGGVAIGWGAGVGWTSNATTSNASNVAIGRAAGGYGQGSGNVALGFGAANGVTGDNNIGIGGSAGGGTVGDRNIALGYNAGTSVYGELDANGNPTSAHDNIAIGSRAGSNVTGDYNVAQGYSAGADVKGTGNYAGGTFAGNQVTGSLNTAVGANAGSGLTGEGNAGLGYGAGGSSSGNYNLAAGWVAGQAVQGSGNVSLGVGAGAEASGNNNVSIGTGTAQGAGEDIVRIGTGAGATRLAAFAGMAQVNPSVDTAALADKETSRVLAPYGVTFSQIAAGSADGTYSVNGNGDLVDVNGAVVVPADAMASVQAALGTAAGSRSINMGRLSLASAEDAIAMGTNALASGKGSVAMGQDSIAAKDGAVAIGQGAQALGEKSIAVGFDAIATGSLAMGASARAGNGGTAFGDGAIATYLGGTTVAGTVAGAALGQNAKADVSAGVAVGTDAEVTAANGVALGAGSLATQDAAALALKNAYVPAGATAVAGTAPVGEVSVGGVGKERRITNLAAGSDNTDAVNVSQLKAAQTHYYSVNDGGVPGGNYDNKGATGPKAIAAGVDATASGGNAVAVGPGAQANGNNSLSVGPNAGQGSSGAYNAAFGTQAGRNVAGTSNVALGGNAGNDVAGDFNLGVGEGAGRGVQGSYNAALGHYAGNGVEGNVNLASGFYAGMNTKGDNNVALGSMAGIGVQASDTVSIGNTALASKNSAVALGREAQARAVNSVALGAESQATQDAAALALKNAYAPGGVVVVGTAPVGEVSVGSAGKERRITNVAAGSDDTDAVNVSQLKAAQTHYYSVNDNGTPGANYKNDGALGQNSLAAGVNASTATGARRAVAVGTDASAQAEESVAVGPSATALQNSATAIGSSARADGATAVAINGQATGTQSTAINGIANGTAAVAIGGASSGTARAEGFSAIAIGGQAQGDNTVALGWAARVDNAENAMALGANSRANVADGVALGSGSVADRAAGEPGFDPRTGTFSTASTPTWKSTLGAVSVGNGTDTRQITGVAAGTAETDAVNVAQLTAAQTHYYSVNDNGTQGGNYDNKGATGINAIASGVDAVAAGVGTVAVGNLAGSGSTAAGNSHNTFVGYAAGRQVVGADNTAVGNSAGVSVTGGNNTALGLSAGARVTGDSNIGIGVNGGAVTTGFSNVGIGSSAGQGTNGAFNVALGGLAGGGVQGSANVAIGLNAGESVSASNTVAIGTRAKATGDSGVSIGTDASATYANAVALGANSTTATDLATLNANAAYVPPGATSVAGATPVGEVSVGGVGAERRITNVAAGAVDTDAVNVSQLKAVDATANAGWNVAANGEATGGNVAPGAKVDFSNSDSNIAITRTGTDLDFKLADDVKVNNSVTVGQSVLNTTGLTVNDGAGNVTKTTAAGTTVTNGTTTTVVAAGGVTSGSVNLSGVTNDIQGLSNKTLTDPSFATVGRAATEEQLKIVNDTASAGWNVAANGEATGSNVAPGGKVDFSNSDSNVTITRSGTNLDFKLADDVKVNNSVTVGQSVLNTTGLTVNNGTTTTAVAAGGVTSGSVNLSGVTNDIQGLSNKTLTDPSFATVGRGATEEQLKIVNDTASAGWNVAANGEAAGGNVAPGGKVDFSNSDSNVTITRTGTNLDFKLADDVKVNNSVTVGQSVLNTTGLTVNNGTTTTAVAAGGVTSGTVNLSGVTNDIKGLSNKTLTDPSFATVGRGATEEQLKLVNDTASAGWNVAANGEATGGNVAPGGKVDFSNSDSNIAITRSGTNLDFKLADDVKVNNSVTVGQSVLNTTGLTVNDGAGNVTTTSATGTTVTNGTTTTAMAAGGVTSGTVNLSGVTNDIQGLSNKTLTDPSFATVGRAATEEQLKIVNDTASAGWNVAANGEATGGNVAPGGKVDFSNSDSNIAITRTGTNLDFKLADDVKVNNSVTVGQSVLNTTGLTVNNGTTTTAVAAGGVTSGSVNLSGVTNDIQGLSNTTLTDPSFATVGRAATEEQLKKVNDTAGAGWNVAANGEATGGNVAPGGKVDFSNSDSNIAITRTGTNLDFKLADDVKVNNSVTVGQSVLNTTGLTVNNGTTTTAVAAGGVTSGSVNLSGVTNDIKGLSNTTLTDPSFATVGRAATEEQLKKVNDTASAGWNVAANGEATGGNVAPGGKVDFSNSDSNVTITRSGTNLDFKLADDVKVNNSVTVGQSVLNTTGLTVNDGTTTTAVAAGGVTSGTVKLSGVSNDIQGLSNKTLTDPSFATVGRGATEEQLKIVNDTASAGWNVAANGEATGGNVAPGGKVDFSNSDSNVTITRTGTNLDFKLANDVKVNNSVTVGQSVLNTTGLTVNDGTTTTAVAAGGVTSGTVKLSGVSNDIQGLSNKTLTDPSFATVGRAATEEQLKQVNDTASAGWNVAANGEATGGNVAPGGKVDFSNSDSNIAITRTGTNLDFKLADDVKVNNSVTVGQSVLNTTGLTVNNGTTTTAVAAGGVTSGTVKLSGVSNDIQGLSNKTLTDPSFATVGRAATEEQLKLVDATASKGWNLSANGEASPQNIAPGGTANFANGDNMVVTRNGNTLTVATAKDVKFDSVTTGDTVMNNAGVTVGPNVTLGATGLTIVGGPSVTTAGVDAGGKVITNVAPGVANTDAVNVSQLKDTVAESKTKYYSVNSTGGGNENNDGATGADAIAAGKDAQATAVNAVAMGTAAQAAGVSATSIGNAAWAMGDRSTAVGYFSTADGIDSAAFGAWARAAGNGSVAAGAASNASGVASVAMGAASAAVGDVSVAVGAGSTATATGGAALGAGSVADRAAGVKGYVPPEATAAQADAIAATTSTTGAVGVGDAANGVFRQITGVAAGSAPSDAVNVAQLQAVASQAAAAGSKWITGSPTTYVAPTSTGTDSTAVGSGAAVKADRGVAIGTGAVVTTKNSVALGNDSTTAEAKPTESVTLQGTTYQFAGTKPVGVVSVGSKDAERQITNVAAGEISATSTDAVNGSQLYATNQAINNMTTGGGGIKYFHANSKAADSNAAGAESVAIGPNAVALGSNAIATGNGAQAKAAGSIALGANSTASAANSVALGDGAVANRAGMNGQREMFSNTVVQSAQGAVSVGSTGNERQITNVAGGTQATDAVNVRQLQAVQQSAVRYDTNVDGSVNYNSVTMGNGASTGPVTVQNVAPGVAPTDAVNVQQLNQAGAANMAYTDARANALGGEIRNVAKNAYAGVAAAMAVQMPGTSVPGKTVMRVGYGTFKGESAVGISFRRTAENNGWSMTGGVGMSRAGAAATVGAEWVFN